MGYGAFYAICPKGLQSVCYATGSCVKMSIAGVHLLCVTDGWLSR